MIARFIILVSNYYQGRIFKSLCKGDTEESCGIKPRKGIIALPMNLLYMQIKFGSPPYNVVNFNSCMFSYLKHNETEGDKLTA